MYILIVSVSEFTNIHVLPRMKILSKLLRMHMHGFHHDDFEGRNVVLGPHGHRIIDLERMSKHQCGWECKVAWENCSEDFPCYTMEEIGDKLHAWEEGTCI